MDASFPILPVPKKGRIIICFIILILSSVSLFGQSGWKTVQEQGFTLKYPGNWNCTDLGNESFNGTLGYTKVLNPVGGMNFAMVIMIFPDFNVDLASAGMTFKDFLKKFFQNFLAQSSMSSLKIQEAECRMHHGDVASYMAVDEKYSEGFKASMICGDFVNGKAAFIILALDISSDEMSEGEEYLTQAEAMMSAFAFP